MDRSELRAIILDQNDSFRLPGGEAVQRTVDWAGQLRTKEISVITGVRRCGKSTLLRQIAAASQRDAQPLYLNFDDGRLFSFSQADFQKTYEILLELSPQPLPMLLFDEVQNVSGWERWMTQFAEYGHKVFITGSNSRMLSSELASHLTGRYRHLHLTPFSFREVADHFFKGKTFTAEDVNKTTIRTSLHKLLAQYLRYGGFPRSYLDSDSTILNQYFQDIVLKDIILRGGIRSRAAAMELALCLATENGKLLNKSRLARTLGVRDNNTLGRYLAYFRETYLFSELRAFSASIRRQQRSLAKYYAVDVALAREFGFAASRNLGQALENLVQIELQREGNPLYYYRSPDGSEVDFLVRRKNSIVQAVQACWSVHDADTLEREIRGLMAVRDEHRGTELLIITEAEKRLITRKKVKIHVLPFAQWAYLLGGR